MAIVSCLCSFVFHLLIVGSSEIGRMDVVHMPECQLCSLQHLLLGFDYCVSVFWMAKLEGYQRGHYDPLVAMIRRHSRQPEVIRNWNPFFYFFVNLFHIYCQRCATFIRCDSSNFSKWSTSARQSIRTDSRSPYFIVVF